MTHIHVHVPAVFIPHHSHTQIWRGPLFDILTLDHLCGVNMNFFIIIIKILLFIFCIVLMCNFCSIHINNMYVGRYILKKF